MQGALLAAELTARPASWLATFASTTQRQQFDTMANQLELAIPSLMREKNIRTLFAVRTILDVISAEGAMEPHWRVARATSMQHAFADPVFLAVLAEAVLSTERPPREVTELLLRVGPPGAYALYSCRLKLTNYEGIRQRFVAAIQAFGESALPMIRAGLARLGARRELVVAAAMAADLLEASPRVRDDGAGEVTAPYIQGSPPALTCLAAAALVAFWGERATPLLIGLLSSNVDEVRVAAIRGLRELGAVDEYLVTKILSAARSTSSPEIRLAARAALLDTTGAARVVAERALAELPEG